MPALARGVFATYDQPLALGRTPRQGEFPDSASWVALPVTPGEGWYRPSKGGWHPTGARAVLDHQAWGDAPTARRALRLDLRQRDRSSRTQRLEVLADGVSVGEVEVVSGAQTHFFPIAEAGASTRTRIELLFDPPLERAPRAPITLTGFGLADEALVHGPLQLDADPTLDDDGRRLRFSHSGRLIASLTPHAEADAIDLEVRCSQGNSRIIVSIHDGDGRVQVSDSLDDCRPRWQSRSIPLPTRLGGLDVLSFDVRLGDEPGASVEIQGVALRGLAPADASGKAETGAAETPSDAAQRTARPDIVVVILDAARAAHFGFAGYERDTTPHLDRLAAESLIFENAYSECPNTACSIPNLITGVPFLNVGTVFKGRQIPDELNTLAEYLKPLGYRTVGFSANPNNSVARNSHQGFDHFERLWGAHIQAKRARNVIAEQPADEPLYLQLHFLPPHQPYMPQSEFDLFTDPDYQGPVHPKVGLRRYTAGFATFTPADLEQLMALYDGNLRMVDDAVSQVFDALKSAGRWDRSLILLTSDHGEAFGEHGDFQHNSTVFDEMLHVPFVLRLPGGVVPEGLDTRSPVSLSDAVPSILSYLGETPRPEVWGLDLLSRRHGEAPSRLLFHRTSHNRRWLLAIRNERWKAITGRGVLSPALLDLESDPLESENIAALRPVLFSALTLRLRDFLEHSDLRVPRTSEDVELSPEEIEVLRSLGYVQ